MLAPILCCYFLLWELEPEDFLRDGMGICFELGSLDPELPLVHQKTVILTE
jgi:hypothetical protein